MYKRQPHAYAIEKIGSDGTTLRIDFDLIATSDFTGVDWEAVDEWLSGTASAAIQGIAADTESLANVVAEAIADARRDAQRAQSAEPWASEALLVSEITVTLPYYPELTSGVNGAATQRLQEALIRLGYLNDDADGYFGPVSYTHLDVYKRQRTRRRERFLCERASALSRSPGVGQTGCFSFWR